MKLAILVSAVLTFTNGCMVKVIPPSTYYCDAVTYPCVTGTCTTIPLEGGRVLCQCKLSQDPFSPNSVETIQE